ncbi:MAG: hypothetical protein HY200_05590 [Nitrospirae bacterium]|nr:hypothetical protein [Nitrospirota bacterium]
MSSFSREEKIEIFKVLYPLFKREVYHRRDQILKVASLSSALFLTLIFIGGWLRSNGVILRSAFFPMIASAVIFELGICYHLYQHKSRHEQAKRMLISLEEQMGFFENGIMEASKGFYPETWRVRGFDPGFLIFPILHGGLIILLGYLWVTAN